MKISDESGSKNLGRVNFCGSGRVGSAIYGLGLNLENFCQNIKFFNFFPFGSKKISSGPVKKYSGQRRVGLLFTVGQK